MTAMYDRLYVYLCRKESLLKYFEQTLVLCCALLNVYLQI